MNYGKKNASKRQRQITSKKAMQKKKLASRLFKSLILCILVIGIAGVAGAGFLIKRIIDDAPNITPDTVKPSAYTTFVVDQNGKELHKFLQSGSNRVYKTKDQIPQELKDAFVAIEDERFYTHNGIDIKGIIRAGVVTISSFGKSTEGASTITQQLIKNTVFPDFVHEEGLLEKFERKFQEQYLAIQIEKQMSKEDILENYMNTINLGQNTLGVQAAAKRYFNKDVSKLTLSECATIAGITQRPGAYNPITNPDANKARRNKVLSNMLEQGYISKKEHDAAVKDDVYARIQTVNATLKESKPSTYFIDALQEQVIQDFQDRLNYTETQAYNALYSGGLTIYATQDKNIQKICDEEMNDNSNFPYNVYVGVDYALTITRADGTQENYGSTHLKKFGKDKYNDKQGRLFPTKEKAQKRIDAFRKSVSKKDDKHFVERIEFSPQPQASVVVMDQKTGYVKAIVGGRGKKETSKSLNRATGSKRQPGSAFKIVGVYAAALDGGGQSLGTVTKDEPFKRGSKSYKNAYRGFRGNVTMRTAIEDSINISALKTFENVTPKLCIDYAKKLGITTLLEKPTKRLGGLYDDLNLSTALGGLTDGVYNLEMAGAFAAIANGGVYNRPVFYTKILDHDGNVLIDDSKESRTVLRKSTAFLLTSAMQDVVTKGTGTQARLSNMPVAGKTGTTTDRADIWFCGYTPYYTCTVWVGYDDNEDLPSGNYNQKLWKSIMSRIHDDLEYKNFQMPSTVAKRKVCSISGKVATYTCPYHMEYIALDGGGDKVCTSHAGYEGSVGGESDEEKDKKKEEEEEEENKTDEKPEEKPNPDDGNTDDQTGGGQTGGGQTGGGQTGGGQTGGGQTGGGETGGGQTGGGQTGGGQTGGGQTGGGQTGGGETGGGQTGGGQTGGGQTGGGQTGGGSTTN